MKSYIENNELVLVIEQRFDLDGSLNLSGTGITELPTGLSVGGKIIGLKEEN
jgi:hypothetical protein